MCGGFESESSLPVNAIESRIIELHKEGSSVSDISSLFGQKWTNTRVAGIIAKSEMIYINELYVVVPSKMNYEFKMIRDYGKTVDNRI